MTEAELNDLAMSAIMPNQMDVAHIPDEKQDDHDELALINSIIPSKEFDKSDPIEHINEAMDTYYRDKHVFNVPLLDNNGKSILVITHKKKGKLTIRLPIDKPQTMPGLLERTSFGNIVLVTPAVQLSTVSYENKLYPVGNLMEENPIFRKPTLTITAKDTPLLPGQERNNRFAQFWDQFFLHTIPQLVELVASKANDWYTCCRDAQTELEKDGKGRSSEEIIKNWPEIFRGNISTPKGLDQYSQKMMQFKYNMLRYATAAEIALTQAPTFKSITGETFVTKYIRNANELVIDKNERNPNGKQESGQVEQLLPVHRVATAKEREVHPSRDTMHKMDYKEVKANLNHGDWATIAFSPQFTVVNNNVFISLALQQISWIGPHDAIVKEALARKFTVANSMPKMLMPFACEPRYKSTVNPDMLLEHTPSNTIQQNQQESVD